MKKVILAVVIAFCGTATSALADPERPEDMHTGSFSGTWCNYAAQFDLFSKKDDWKFDGKIRIHKTNQYDRLWIRQYRDNSLQIIRYLSGEQDGQIQNVKTFPPQILRGNGGQQIARFKGAGGGGPGCKNARVEFNLTPE
jgi:hypothetical protein